MKIKFLFVALFLSINIFAMGPIPPEEMKDKLSLFEYNPNTRLTKFKRIHKNMWMKIYSGKLLGTNPADGRNLNIPFYYLRPKRISGKRPLMIVFPPIFGANPIDWDLAIHFVLKKYNVIMALMPEDISDPNRPVSDINDFLVRTTISSRMLIDLASSWKHVDSSKIGAIGISLGGIRASLLLGVDLRLDAAVTFVAGGNFPEIVTNSQQKIMKNWRETRMEIEGIPTNKDFLEKISEVMEIDPIYFASRRNRKDIFMIVGKKDNKVPTINQYELWKSFREPKAKFLPAGHVQTALTWKYFLPAITRYFKKKLNGKLKSKDIKNNFHESKFFK